MKLEVYSKRIDFPEFQALVADWKSYKLVLFNIFQNSVKYNNMHGQIVILLKYLDDSTLETEVIDTGIGIQYGR